MRISDNTLRMSAYALAAGLAVAAVLLLATYAPAQAGLVPGEHVAGEYGGNLAVFLDGATEEKVMLELSVSEDGLVQGEWDHQTVLDMDRRRVPWRTTAEFEGWLVSQSEFLATGSMTEAPTLTGEGTGLLDGEMQVRGTFSDDGLILMTLFAGDERLMFQAVELPEGE